MHLHVNKGRPSQKQSRNREFFIPFLSQGKPYRPTTGEDVVLFVSLARDREARTGTAREGSKNEVFTFELDLISF